MTGLASYIICGLNVAAVALCVYLCYAINRLYSRLIDYEERITAINVRIDALSAELQHVSELINHNDLRIDTTQSALKSTRKELKSVKSRANWCAQRVREISNNVNLSAGLNPTEPKLLTGNAGDNP